MVYLLVIVLFVLFFNLRNRLEKLEHLMKAEGIVSAPVVVPSVSAPVTSPVPMPTPVASTSPDSSSENEQHSDIIGWLQRDWLLKLGGLLILVAFGWFVSYAFINDWVGPAGRVSIGLMAGAMLLCLGYWRIQEFVHQGSIFLVTGSTTIMLTLYAARSVYDFFTPLSALALMFLSVVVVAFASVLFRMKSLAIASLVLAGVAPLLTDAPITEHVELFSYLMIVLLGTLWIVFVTRWRELSFCALLMVTAHSFSYFLPSMLLSDKMPLLLLAFGFVGLIFLANIVSIVRNATSSTTVETAAILGNSLFLVAWVLAVGQQEWQSFFLIVWMMVFLVVSFVVARLWGRNEVFYLHGVAAMILLVTATAIEFDGPALTLAYIVESLLVPVAVMFFSRNIEKAVNSSVFIIGPMFLAFASYSSQSWYRGIFHADFVVLFLVASGLMALGLYFLKNLPSTTGRSYFQLSNFYVIAGSVYFYMLIWKVLHAGQLSNVYTLASLGTMIAYLIYTSIGIICYFQGSRLAKNGLRLYGGVLVLVVIARLALFDVWRMELSGRIATFFVLGALLMGTAFVQSKRKEKLV